MPACRRFAHSSQSATRAMPLPVFPFGSSTATRTTFAFTTPVTSTIVPGGTRPAPAGFFRFSRN